MTIILNCLFSVYKCQITNNDNFSLINLFVDSILIRRGGEIKNMLGFLRIMHTRWIDLGCWWLVADQLPTH